VRAGRKVLGAGATLEHAGAVAVGVWIAAGLAAVGLLAAVHVDDRYGVSAASGVWIGLTAAAHAGHWYPPVYTSGFYGGTRYMPVPVLIELGGRAITGEYLVSAKLLIYAVNVALYLLVYRAARSQGAPALVSLSIVVTVLASSAATTTALGFRWDALAAALQLGAVAVVSRAATAPRAATAGVLCGLALATKVTSLWALAALAVLLVRKPGRLVALGAATAATFAVVAGGVDLASHGRLLAQMRDFTFAGSAHSSLREGVHRFYQLGLRNERSLPLLLLLALAALLLAAARRRIGPYEIGLVFALPIVIVVLRDFGAYENHLLDLQILCGLVVAGIWRESGVVAGGIARATIVGLLFLAFLAAGRHTLLPDVRTAASHELRGRRAAAYSLHPVPAITAQGTCALFEDAAIPLLAGQQPVVLDAFIAHRLQTVEPSALEHLLRRVRQRTFSTVVLSFPLTNRGWFQTLDFGTAFADAAAANYRLVEARPEVGVYVYVPRSPPIVRRDCHVARLADWR
jgi:Glycosyltransferase family 87